MARMSHVLSAVAWPYANGPRHIGHVAGFGVPSDIFSRYMRAAGHDVLMVSGTDEHGTPILIEADKQELTAQELADKYNRIIVEDMAQLGLSYDMFTRTSTGNHHAVVQSMFTTLRDNGYMMTQKGKGAISPSTGRTLPDRYIEGTCPKCGYVGARGDQCDGCGQQLDPSELIDPKSRINGETPKFIETEHFYLDLPAVADALREWLSSEETASTWRPNVLKFSLNLLDDMRPRAMTRDIDWGIKIPLEGWQDQAKRFYVWFDAVIGYLSATIEWARRSGDSEAWRNWWNDPTAQSYYFMGKDNITFHSQIWPGELIAYNGTGAHGGNPGEYGALNLPTDVVSSEYLTMEGAKFSTSRGVVLYIRDVLERYQPDAIRFFLAAAGPENQDTDFAWSEFVRRVNDELVASWGNLVNRTASLIHKNIGHIPPAGNLIEADHEMLKTAEAAFDEVGGLLAQNRVKLALQAALRLVGEANKYLADHEPWKLKKTDLDRMATVLHVAAQVISDCNTILAPFMPHSANKIHTIFGRTGIVQPMPTVAEVTDLDSDRQYPIITGDYSTTLPWRRHLIQEGTEVAKPAPVFTKLDPEIIDQELERMELSEPEPQG